MAEYQVRPATPQDATAIALIYNQGIEDRLATLETELRTPEERHQWLSARSPRHPVILSVYVERGWRGKGVGRVLLARLIELGREHGYHKLVLSAFPFNKPGVALYEKLGFRTVGIYHEQGMLDGQWVDTIIMEKLL